jgi:outer membrane protein assembly factor BamA
MKFMSNMDKNKRQQFPLTIFFINMFYLDRGLMLNNFVFFFILFFSLNRAVAQEGKNGKIDHKSTDKKISSTTKSPVKQNIKSSPKNSSSNDSKVLQKNIIDPPIKKVSSSTTKCNYKKCPKCTDITSKTDDEISSNQATSHQIVLKLQIESIVFIGNKNSNKNFLKSQLTIKKGDHITPDDGRLQSSRLKLLSLGLFIDVEFFFKKGSSRGKIILNIHVRERGTLLIKNIFGGSSKIIPFWLGLGMENKNFLGRGLTVGLSGIVTAVPQIMGGKEQHALETYISSPSLFKIPIKFGIHYASGSEFYRIFGDSDDGDPSNFLSLQYKKAGINLQTFFPVGPFFLHMGFNNTLLFTHLPSEAVRHYEDGTSKSINFGIRDGISSIGLFKTSLVYDSRNRPILPSSGMFLQLIAKVGSPFTLSKYTFFTGEINWSKFFSLRSHVVSLHFFGGAIAGDAPLFAKYFIGDLQDLVPHRALGLNLSVSPSPNFMNTGISDARWGTGAFKFFLRYDYPLFKRKGAIYKGNFFISAGVFGLTTQSRLKYREGSIWETSPIDLTFDIGFHLDTKIGTFRLSFSNIVDRVPF